MTLTKRWRILRALLTTTWHEHACTCGTTWICSRRSCDHDDVCAVCEQALLNDWADRVEARARRIA